MKKIKLYLSIVFMLVSTLLVAQNSMTITNPVLSSPYQVTSGTAVTFTWSSSGTAPTAFFSYNQTPTIQAYLPPNAAWTQHTNFTNNGNGTYSLTLTVTSDIWVWGGLNGFIGWNYSNVLPVQVISSMIISASDSMICPTGGSVLFTASTGTGYTYQWYNDTNIISGATNSTYTATTAGSYHCVINNGSANITNTISISNYEATFTGALNGTQLDMTADQSFTSYQWFQRVGTGTPTAITGATTNQYSASITSSLVYYSYEGDTTGSCTVNSIERPVVDTLFSTPVVVLNTTFNGSGNICDGTPTSLVTTGGTGFIQWIKDGTNSYTNIDSVNLFFGSSQNGVWSVNNVPSDWPEIAISSNSVTVNFVTLITPVVTGANYSVNFCPGDIVPMILTDEGYTYTWYLHDTINVYNSTHVISVPTGVYQHSYVSDKYVTIEGTFNGCTTKKVIVLSGWASQNIYLSLDNYTQQYLCVDSTINILFPAGMVSDYQSFQWYENLSGTWTVMTNDTNPNLTADSPGEYRVVAASANCPLVSSTSDSKIIYSYLDRQPSIFTYDDNICEGESTTLFLSGGANWYAKQWLEADVMMVNGYVRVYVGMITNTASDTQNVDTYGSYQLSTKHISCPNGLKVKSNIVFITPTVHPVIDMITPLDTMNLHVITWDSTRHVIGCQYEPIAFTLTNTDYDSIMWYDEMYAGDDDYVLGTYFSSLDSVSNYPIDAKHLTAVVIDSNGCKGQSTPLLLDTWVFQSPAVTSYGNNELCEVGDSALMHLAFPGTWVAYQWYLDGVVIPGATNDSIWGKDPGTYVLNAFPAACPTFEYSSGLGPTLTMLTPAILEWQDSLIYASPFQGYYSFQWFFNGDSIDVPDTNYLHILQMDSMQAGTYTVAITNNSGCTKLSDPYVWSPSGVKDIFVDDLARVYPNPTNGILTIDADQPSNISAITLIDVKGDVVYRTSGLASNTIDISDLSSGVYILRIDSRDGFIQRMKVLKQ